MTEPVKAMRASELYPDAPLFASGVGSNDIVQGAVGDCFYIGAVSALATAKDNKLKPLERLFVYHDIKWGIYGVCFFKNGEWEWVIVDDWIAVSQVCGRAAGQCNLVCCPVLCRAVLCSGVLCCALL